VLAERAGGIPGWRAGLAYVYAELEQEPGAREIFEGFAEDEFRVIPRDITWIMTMNLLADVCAFLGDVRRAGLLYDMLAPYGHLNAVVGTALACTGSVSRSLGRLATMMERWDAAEQHFRDALVMNTNLRSPTWVAYTKRDYAALLLATRDPAKREKAIRLLDESLETARQVGMHNLEGKIGTLKESMASVALPR
jgi:tetratricopeptide (TPR) repeat protein